MNRLSSRRIEPVDLDRFMSRVPKAQLFEAEGCPRTKPRCGSCSREGIKGTQIDLWFSTARVHCTLDRVSRPFYRLAVTPFADDKAFLLKDIHPFASHPEL